MTRNESNQEMINFSIQCWGFSSYPWHDILVLLNPRITIDLFSSLSQSILWDFVVSYLWPNLLCTFSFLCFDCTIILTDLLFVCFVTFVFMYFGGDEGAVGICYILRTIIGNIFNIFVWVLLRTYCESHSIFTLVLPSEKTKRRRSDPVLWQKPLHEQKCQKGKVTTQTTPQKSSIKQRLRTA